MISCLSRTVFDRFQLPDGLLIITTIAILGETNLIGSVPRDPNVRLAIPFIFRFSDFDDITSYVKFSFERIADLPRL